MARLDLARLLRGSTGKVADDLLGLLPGGGRIESGGKTLRDRTAGPGQEGARYPIVVAGAEIGAVVGAEGADRIARALGHLYEREQEKLALANETLGRYKELTVLYDLGDALARVLEVEDVGRLVVEQTHRLLRAAHAGLHLLDPRAGLLEDVSGGPAVPLGDGVEARVVRTGQAELLEEGGRSILCAPLRTGDAVFGLLRAASGPDVSWTAGELKLVTALAGSAASAIRHAMLHREQLRQQALRGRIERFVSPLLAESTLSAETAWPVPVLVCDLGEVSRSADAALGTAALVEVLAGALVATLDELLARGATVNTVQGDMLVAVFASETELHAGAAAATAAARALARRVAGSQGLGAPGIGLSAAPDAVSLLQAIGIAASLQAAAGGRILADTGIARALDPAELTSGTPVRVRDDVLAHEVRA